MKSNYFIAIFICMAISLFSACEQAELRKSNDNSVQIVETRSIEDCEECPEEDCCCTIVAITEIPFFSLPLTFCGTTSQGTSTPCSVSSLGICDDIIGNTELITLTELNMREQFCAALNQTFGITSTLPFIPGIVLAIHCQDGIFPPQTVYIDLGTTGNKPFWQLGGECVLESCF